MVCSLTELARLPDMPSEPKLRRLIALNRDFPVERHGTHGRKYQFDVEAVRAFFADLARREEDARAERQARVRSFRDQLFADHQRRG